MSEDQDTASETEDSEALLLNEEDRDNTSAFIKEANPKLSTPKARLDRIEEILGRMGWPI